MDFHCTASGKFPKISLQSPIHPSLIPSVAMSEQLLPSLCNLQSMTIPFVQDDNLSEETSLTGQQGESNI